MIFFVAGHFGTGKTMTAAEVVKIIWAIKLEENSSEIIDVYALSYNENFDELIRNLKSKWFQDYNLNMISSFYFFMGEFSARYDLDQEEKQIMQTFPINYPEELKAVLTTIAKHLQKSGKTSIIMIDEMCIEDAMVGIEKETPDGNSLFDVDFTYLSKYTKVHFIIALRPIMGNRPVENSFKPQLRPGEKQNNFQVQLHTAKNQNAQIFCQRYRCAEEIKKFLDFLQSENIEWGYPKIDANEYMTKEVSPPTFGNCPGVIWVPAKGAEDYCAIVKVETLIKGLDMNKEPSVAVIDDTFNCRDLSFAFSERNPKWIGPHGAFAFNGGEADVVLLVVDVKSGSLCVQSCARARRLLIIVTGGIDKDWKYSGNYGNRNYKPSKWHTSLKNAVIRGLVVEK